MALSDAPPWKIGDKILSIKPLVCVPQTEESDKICDSCLNWHDNLLRCSICKSVYYCSKKCQKLEWSSHKLECGVLKDSNNPLLKLFSMEKVRLVTKLVGKFLKNPGLKLSDLTDSAGLKSLQDLPTFLDKRSSDFMKVYNMYCKIITKICQEKGYKPLPTDLLITLFCIGESYTFKFPCVTKFERSYLGCDGLVPSLFAFEMSCAPNADYYLYDGMLHIKAVSHISRSSCEDYSGVTFSYDNIFLHPLELRQEYFKERLFKECTCKRCCEEAANSTFLIRCSSSSCTGISYLDKLSWTCSSCTKCSEPPHPKANDRDYVYKYRESLLHIFDDDSLVSASKKLSDYLSGVNNPLHPLDLACLLPYMNLAESLSNLGSPEHFKNAALIRQTVLLPGLEMHAPWKFLLIAHTCTMLAFCLEGDDLAQLEAFKLAKTNFEVLLEADTGPVQKTAEICAELELKLSRIH